MSTTTTPTTTLAVVDPSRCPLCGQPNACAMAGPGGGGGQPASPCWCTTAHFSAALLQSVPLAAQHKACICAACAASAAQAAL